MLREWESFYVIVGSSAAALTGLQFVVIALTAREHVVRDPQAVEAFGTPTIVHFCVVLTISGLMCVPRQTPFTLALCFTLLGLFGIALSLFTAHRTRRQTGYTPVMSDWLWHVGFPLVAYIALLATGVSARTHADGALYFVAAVALTLLFIGIHNAWDSAVYISTIGPDR